jgi:hypothetical protein
MFSAGSEASKGVEGPRPSLLAIAERVARHGNCTLGVHHNGMLDEPACGADAQLVWRPVFGWVDRTTAVEEPEPLRVAS